MVERNGERRHLGRNNRLMVNASVYEGDADEPLRTHDVDMAQPGNREWVMRMCIWALSNGHAVEFVPIAAVSNDRQERNNQS